jgi:hypothetical protein
MVDTTRFSPIYRLLAMAAFLCVAATDAKASTISSVGNLIDLGSGWRTSTVSKGGFANTGEILGTDGYYVPGAQGVTLKPVYASSWTANSSTYPGNGGYAYIDNPTTTPGAHPTTLLTGTFNPYIGTNNSTTVLSLTLNGSAPTEFQVGLMVDNLDVAIYNDYAIKLSSSISGVGPSVSLTGSAYNNRIPDWVFFDVTGAVAGETISIIPTAGAGTTATLGGASFDTVANAPEPASLALLGSGLAMLGIYRRRARR